MKRNARPRYALHEGHVAVFIDVGLMHLLFLHDAENARRGLQAGLPRRDGRLQHAPAVAVVDRYALVAKGDDGKHRRTRGIGLPLSPSCLAAALSARPIAAARQGAEHTPDSGQDGKRATQKRRGFHVSTSDTLIWAWPSRHTRLTYTHAAWGPVCRVIFDGSTHG